MIALNNLTVSGNQTSRAILADGTTVTFVFIYRAAVQRWTVDVAYAASGFTAKAVGLSTHPNLLRLWGVGGVIPFGLQVSTVDGTDPFMPSDLDCSQGNPRVTLTVLDSTAGGTDIADVEAQYFQAGSPPAY